MLGLEQVNNSQDDQGKWDRPARPGSVPSTFGLLPKQKSNPTSVLISTIVNVSILVLILTIGLIFHKEIVKHVEEHTELVLPENQPKPEPPKPVKLPPTPKIEEPPIPKPVELERQKIIVPKEEVAPQPKPDIKLDQKLELKSKDLSVKLAPQPKAAIVAAASPAQTPQAHPKVEAVHVGALYGVAPNPNATKAATISAFGNPSGGNEGKVKVPQGVVGSAGIGNGTKSGSNAGTPFKVVSAGIPGGSVNGTGSGVPHGQVGSAGIQQKVAVATPPPSMTSEIPSTNVEVTYQPKPEYSAEARQLKIEGEVVVRVTFTASGQVQVVGIVKSLGHGLDEQARRIIPMIKFKPATKNGKPIDVTTNIRITFQVA